MKTINTSKQISQDTYESIFSTLQKNAKKHDTDSSFVKENYELLKSHKLFSALIPEELGGMGMKYTAMCNLLKEMGKRCGSTALAFSMHQHLIAAAVWKYKHKNIGEATLRKIAENQLILVSTGARDWLGSNGNLKKTKDGYLFSAEKHFASQSVVGDVAITSAPYLNENKEWKVLHFSAPIKQQGVSIIENWDVLGMRGTGSCGIAFDSVFIPENAIALERKQDEFHPVWNVVLTVAMPLIMSVYTGIAERAMEIVLFKAKEGKINAPHLNFCLGKLHNSLIAAQSQWKTMYMTANDLDFDINHDNSATILSLKTNVVEACKQTVSDAMEIIGGQSFYAKNELERLFRDVQAASFHPLPKWNQFAFTADKLLSN